MGEALRLDATPEAADGCCQHQCAECGASFVPGAIHGLFCGIVCRKAFNNRRATRGADLYDLYMAYRFDRQAARELNVQAAMNRLAALWREEDRAARAGRRSWAAPGVVLGRRPYLLTKRGRV